MAGGAMEKSSDPLGMAAMRIRTKPWVRGLGVLMERTKRLPQTALC